MEKLSHFLYQYSTWWVALLGVIIFLVFSALTLPGQNAIAAEYSQGAGSPDTSLFYTGASLFRLAELYGQEGREAYLKARWTFDVAFPIVYTFFLLTAISWLFNRTLPVHSRWRIMNLVPLVAMVLDFLENSATSLVMARYPLHCPPAELLAPLFTPLKWLFVGASFVLLIVAVLYKLMKRKKGA